MHISQTILTNLNKFCVGDKILVCVCTAKSIKLKLQYNECNGEKTTYDNN